MASNNVESRPASRKINKSKRLRLSDEVGWVRGGSLGDTPVNVNQIRQTAADGGDPCHPCHTILSPALTQMWSARLSARRGVPGLLGLVSSFTPVRIESTTASALWMQATISRKNPGTVICSSLLLLPFRCHEERGAGFTTRCTEFETWCGRLTIAGLWDRVPNRSSIYACASAKPFMSQYEDIHYSWPLVRSCCQMRCGQSHWCVRPS